METSGSQPNLTSLASGAFRVGMRLVVRHRLPADVGGSGPSLTDAVGTVADVHADEVILDTRHGQRAIPLSAITAVKEIPPAPGRRGQPHRALTVSALEELMVDGWAPREREWLGRWLLRADGGFTGRANSCLTLGDPGLPEEVALTRVTNWYAARSLPALLQVPLAPGGADPRDDALVADALAAGWSLGPRVHVMTAAAASVAQQAAGRHEAGGGDAVDARITLADRPDDAWWSLVDNRMATSASVAQDIMLRSPSQRFATAVVDGVPVARARSALVHGWCGIFTLTTAPGHRRRGHGRAMVSALAEDALARGIVSLYLQVSADNETAVRLYESLGFSVHHDYVYVRTT